MLRSMFRSGAFFAFVMLAWPGAPQAQSPAGLAYDEIARVVPSDATPPPPDAFAHDLAVLQSAPKATPAPRRRGLFGSARREDAPSPPAPNLGAFSATLAPFVPGRLERHALLHGWERIDDPVAHIATIFKCDAGQVIRLDLERKRYRVLPPPTPEPNPIVAGDASGHFSHDAVALGPQTIAGVAAQGYAAIERFEVTSAHGSCSGGALSAATQTYYAPIAEPRRTCPALRPAVPPAPIAWLAHDGCRPTLEGRSTGPIEPVGQFAIFRLQRLGPGMTKTAAGFEFLIERGNAQTLGASEQALFEIPPDFRPDS